MSINNSSTFWLSPKSGKKTQGGSIGRPLFPFCRKTRESLKDSLVFLAKSQFKLIYTAMRQGQEALGQNVFIKVKDLESDNYQIGIYL